MGLRKSDVNHRYFIMLCTMGAFAILSSTMSKSPVLNPFAKSLGTPSDLFGVVAAAFNHTWNNREFAHGVAFRHNRQTKSSSVRRVCFRFRSVPVFVRELVGGEYVLVRFYHGFATAVFVPVTEATVAERFPSKRGERISILNSATGVGRTVAPTLGGCDSRFDE